MGKVMVQIVGGFREDLEAIETCLGGRTCCRVGKAEKTSRECEAVYPVCRGGQVLY